MDVAGSNPAGSTLDFEPADILGMETLKERIVELRKQEKTYAEITAELGCSKAIVSYHLNPETKAKAIAGGMRHRNKKLALLNALKEEKPCSDCGEFFEGYLMDFDHLPDFIKVHHVSRIVKQRSWGKVLEELAKCELVCCMCHRKRTKERWLTNPLLSE